jgi:hypothetical protein
MNLLVLMLLLLILIGVTYLIGYLGVKLFYVWKQTSEEAFFHLGLFFVYLGLALGFMGTILALNVPFTVEKIFLPPIAVLYGFYYLELYFFYLSFFSNSKNILEKYLVILLVTSMLTAILAIINIDFFFLAFIFQGIAIGCGIYIIIKMVYRFLIRKRYFKEKNEREFINLLLKVLIFVLIGLIFDGIGYLSMWIISYHLNEILLLGLTIVFIIMCVITFILSKRVILYSHKIDIISFFNVLS